MVMEKYIDKASKVADRMKYIPPILLKECAGLILIEATEIGLGISGTSGAGVLISHRVIPKDGKADGDMGWSPPVAVKLLGLGAGAVIGAAHKDIVVALNPLALERFLEGTIELKLGEDIGFAAGPVGASAASDVGATEKFGWATSFIYTSQDGGLINVEVTGTGIKVDKESNKAFYGSDNMKDILEGRMTVPEGTAGKKVPVLQEKIIKHCNEKIMKRGNE